MTFNNSVFQQGTNTMVTMGYWNVGLWITDDGSLEVYIDHDLGDVGEHDEYIAENDSQWASRFSCLPTWEESPVARRIRHLDSNRNNVRVEVTP